MAAAARLLLPAILLLLPGVPGKIKAGSNCDAVAGTTDVVSLAGGTPRKDIRIDGLDISPVMLYPTSKLPHRK